MWVLQYKKDYISGRGYDNFDIQKYSLVPVLEDRTVCSPRGVWFVYVNDLKRVKKKNLRRIV